MESDRLAFVDRRRDFPPGDLTLSEDGRELELRPEGEYFYLRKGQDRKLGDERVSYSGIPVPEVATYFGEKIYQAGQQLGFSKGKVRHLVKRAEAA